MLCYCIFFLTAKSAKWTQSPQSLWLHSVTAVQVCDATNAEQRSGAGYKKTFFIPGAHGFASLTTICMAAQPDINL
jgi:hypothetical protein